MELKVLLEDGAPLPKHAQPGDAGMDLTARKHVIIPPGATRIVGTGVHVEIPAGYVGLMFPRSGLACKRGVTLANGVGVIDSSYRGEMMAPLLNLNTEAYVEIEEGERVCQLVLVKFASCECVSIDSLSDTRRGDGGFGSTGRI